MNIQECLTIWKGRRKGKGGGLIKDEISTIMRNDFASEDQDVGSVWVEI